MEMGAIDQAECAVAARHLRRGGRTEAHRIMSSCGHRGVVVAAA